MRIFRMKLKCLTPLHCGGGDDDAIQDQPVARDAFGLWRIPGSSLAGILRHHAARMDEKMTNRLFGEPGENGTRASRIWCADGRLLDFDGRIAFHKAMAGERLELPWPLGPFMRDHVRIDMDRGAAVSGGKFDAEIVPAGTRFAVQLTMDGWDKKLESEEEAFFDRLCADLKAGAVSFGGKTGIGYGRYKASNAHLREFDLHTPEGMQQYLNLSDAVDFLPTEGRDVPLPQPIAHPGKDGLWGTLEIPFVLNGPLLVGGGSDPDSKSKTDLTYGRAPYLNYKQKKLRLRPVVPGSSFRGVIRHSVYHVARALGAGEKAASGWIDELFGHIDDEDHTEGRCGKVVFEDTLLEAKTPSTIVQHVAIDRFTGGALDGALYDEEPLWDNGRPLPLRLHMAGLNAREAALLFHVLLDMGQGRIALGGGGTRGNGALRLPHWPDDPDKALASFSGDLFWEGASLLPLTAKDLQAHARTWDTAVQAELEKKGGAA